MGTKFFEELIGKECEICLRGDNYETATLVAVDGDWLKLDDDGKTILVNSRQLCSLSVEKEEESRDKRRRGWGR